MDTNLLKIPTEMVKGTRSEHLYQDTKLLALREIKDCFEIALMTKIWNIIPVWFNSTRFPRCWCWTEKKKMVDIIDSLEKFLESCQDRYEKLELDAKKFCDSTGYKSTLVGSRRRNKQYDAKTSSVSEVVFSLIEKLKCKNFNVLFDQ